MDFTFDGFLQAHSREAKFSYVSAETRIPSRHPLRPIRALVAEALVQMDRKLALFQGAVTRLPRRDAPDDFVAGVGLSRIQHRSLDVRLREGPQCSALFSIARGAHRCSQSPIFS
jgi:hypothetical protein